MNQHIIKLMKKTQPKHRRVCVFCYGLGNTLRSVKDLIKHFGEHRAKNKENFKKSEKILALIDALPVQS